jgi:hypothetical protein
MEKESKAVQTLRSHLSFRTEQSRDGDIVQFGARGVEFEFVGL